MYSRMSQPSVSSTVRFAMESNEDELQISGNIDGRVAHADTQGKTCDPWRHSVLFRGGRGIDCCSRKALSISRMRD